MLAILFFILIKWMLSFALLSITLLYIRFITKTLTLFIEIINTFMCRDHFEVKV